MRDGRGARQWIAQVVAPQVLACVGVVDVDSMIGSIHEQQPCWSHHHRALHELVGSSAFRAASRQYTIVIAEADLPIIFEPFRQGQRATRRGGLGIGLDLVRRLSEMHGGGDRNQQTGIANPSRNPLLACRLSPALRQPASVFGVWVHNARLTAAYDG